MAKESIDFVKNSLSTQIIKCEVLFYQKIKKNNLSKVYRSKDKIKAISLKEEQNLYTSLFFVSQLRDCNMGEFFKHKYHNYLSLYFGIWNSPKTS